MASGLGSSAPTGRRFSPLALCLLPLRGCVADTVGFRAARVRSVRGPARVCCLLLSGGLGEGPQKPRHRPRDVKMSESLIPRRGDATSQVFKVLTIAFSEAVSFFLFSTERAACASFLCRFHPVGAFRSVGVFCVAPIEELGGLVCFLGGALLWVSRRGSGLLDSAEW